VDNRVHNGCKSRWPKIWKKGIAESIFDIQLHGILAIKGSAGENGNPLKGESWIRRRNQKPLKRWKLLQKASGK